MEYVPVFSPDALLTTQGTFLALHLWSNAVLALIYHPDLLKSPSGIETPLNATMNRNVKLALASSRQICEAMVFADLVDSASYVRVMTEDHKGGC